MLRKTLISTVAALSLVTGATASAATSRMPAPLAGENEEIAGTLTIVLLAVAAAAILLLFVLDDDDEEGPQSP